MISQTPTSSVRTHELPSLKARIKRRLQAMPALWGFYWRCKQQLKRIALLRYFLHDVRQTYRAMFWPAGQERKGPLSAELLFQYHKLEKGLSMPGELRFFGAEPALATVELVQRWIRAGHSRSDPVYLGAIETLTAYLRRNDDHSLEPSQAISAIVRQLLSESSERAEHLSTPQPLPDAATAGGDSARSFRALALARRSVRDFRPDRVDDVILEDCLAIAQLAPSACNRQPWFVYFIDDKVLQKNVLQYQNGNRGFGHLAPLLAVITADETCFFDASERHEPYIDGGLFAMSFALALRAHGVGSCCLNWCVPPSNDDAVHRLLGIPASKRIIMLMAIGYPVDGCVVPRSPRRALGDVFAKV